MAATTPPDRTPEGRPRSITFGIASVKIQDDSRMQAAISNRLRLDREELKKDITDRRRAWLEIRITDYLKCQKWLSENIRKRGERATK